MGKTQKGWWRFGWCCLFLHVDIVITIRRDLSLDNFGEEKYVYATISISFPILSRERLPMKNNLNIIFRKGVLTMNKFNLDPEIDNDLYACSFTEGQIKILIDNNIASELGLKSTTSEELVSMGIPEKKAQEIKLLYPDYPAGFIHKPLWDLD